MKKFTASLVLVAVTVGLSGCMIMPPELPVTPPAAVESAPAATPMPVPTRTQVAPEPSTTPEPTQAQPAPTATTEPAAEPTPDMTVSQENAVESAQSYLRLMPFSRTGLIEQLEYEGFSNADATFGVDYLDADWMEQAELSAESYMDLMPFSRESLIDQLEYEGFTPEQAAYGASEVGL